MVVVCGECSDTKWFIQPGYGAWLISCSNGHKLIPTGGTEYVIDQSSQLSQMQSADRGGASYGDHPSGGQADRDTSVLSSPEAREQSESGRYGSERGEDGGTVTTTTEIWDRMKELYQEALGKYASARAEEKKRREELSQARAEIQKQRERANRSQNEAQARASELRTMGYQLKELKDRNENQFEQIQNLLIEKRERQTMRYTEAWDKLMEIAPQFKDALEELLLDE